MQKKKLVIATMFVACLAMSSSALGQSVVSNKQRGGTYEESRKRLKVNRPDANTLDQLGYVIGDNIIISPTVEAQSGYDSNPDNLFVEADSAYGTLNTSVVLGFVKPNQATTLALKGKISEYEGLEKQGRWDAGVTLDTYYAFKSGLEISGGALHLHDAHGFTENESTASYFKLQYKNSSLEAYAQGLVHQVRYLSQSAIDSSIASSLQKFYVNAEYNMLRAEQSIGALFYKNKVFSPYVEGGYGSYDYIDQKIASDVNRDANSYFFNTGIRISIFPTIQADIGYRFTKYDLDDNVFQEYDIDYIDAKLTWAPTANFRAVFEVDKQLGTPIGAQSRLSEVTKHLILAQYQPAPRWLYSLSAFQKRSKDIGDTGRYRERTLETETTYDINNKTQFFFTNIWSQLKEEASDSSYDRYKLGLGIRVKYNATDSEKWSDFASDLKSLTSKPKIINTGIAYGHLILPTTKMTTVTDPFLTSSQRHVTDHDGHIGGGKLWIDLGQTNNIKDFQEPNSSNLNLKAFIGLYSSKQSSTCNFTLAFDCLFVNIIDPDSANDNNTGAFGNLLTRTKREVTHWGLAVDAPVSKLVETKDAKVIVPTAWKLGIAVKALEQTTSLHAIDTAVPDPVDYNEILDTYYYGVYASYNQHIPIRSDLSFNFQAEAGVYFADTSYEGKYVAYVPIGGSNYILDTGNVKLNHQQEAFIGSLKADLTKRMDWGNISLTGEAEYFSYAPGMKYNDNDFAGGGINDLIGQQVGTSIQDDHALSLTLGARVTIPLDKF